MAEYYHSGIEGIHSAPRRSRGGWILSLFDGLMAGVSLLLFLLSILSLIAPLSAPRGWFFPVVGLMVPILYALDLLLMLYWVIRWRWWRVVGMALPVVVGLFFLGQYLRLDFKSGLKQEPRRRGVVRLVDYNVRQFYGWEGESTSDSLLVWLRNVNSDIICLQEYYPESAGTSREKVDSILGRDYHLTTGDTLTHNAIFSRYPILRSARTCPSLPGLRSVWADLKVHNDTIRIFNNHMQSTTITSADAALLHAEEFLQDTAREAKLFSIFQRLGENSRLRAVQADSVAAAVARSPHPVVVCGDFNDVPFSYTYRHLAEGLQDLFREVGKGYSSTYYGFHNLLRIDFVLASKDVRAVSYREGEPRYSDHKPLVVEFLMPDPKE